MNTLTLKNPSGPVTLDDIWAVLVELSRRVQAVEEKLPVGTSGGDNAGEMDETEYLMSTPANRKHLEEALANLDAGKGIEVDMAQLEAMVR